MLFPAHYAEVVKCGRMTCDVTMVIDRGRGFQMFFKPLSKCSSCLSYVLLIAFQPIIFVSIDYTTLFCYVVFVFWCHLFIFYGFSTLEVNVDAISFTDVLESFTESFIVRNSYVAFADGLVVFIAVVVAFGVLVLTFILLIAHAGYLQDVKALWICICSSSNRSWLEHISLAPCSNELITLYLFDMAW